jgi:hypothetical protein
MIFFSLLMNILDHRFILPKELAIAELARRLFVKALGSAHRILDHYGRDAALVLLGRVLQNLNGFLLSVLIVHQFGLAAAGTLAVATVATVAITVLGTFGLIYVFPRIDAPASVKNALGFTAALVVVPLSLPFAIGLGLVAGRSLEEAAIIALLSLGGCFFAQANRQCAPGAARKGMAVDYSSAWQLLWSDRRGDIWVVLPCFRIDPCGLSLRRNIDRLSLPRARADQPQLFLDSRPNRRTFSDR